MIIRANYKYKNRIASPQPWLAIKVLLVSIWRQDPIASPLIRPQLLRKTVLANLAETFA
jgi:hypothetical protein